MRFPMRLAILILTISVALTSGLKAQDPGSADTVRIGVDSCSIAASIQPISIPLYLTNDEPVASIAIPMLIDGSSGWAVFDSISYVGSRLEISSVLDARQVVTVDSDTFSYSNLLITFVTSSGTNLPAGSGKLCDLWFKPAYGGTVVLDISGASALTMIDGAANVFSPQFQVGAIVIACDYVVGNIDGIGALTASDILMMQKLLVWHLGYTGHPTIAAFDLNADRHQDMRDIVYYVNWIYYSGPPPVSCGNYSPALYNDPGERDSVSIGPDTIYAGVPTLLHVNLFNDEPIRSFNFALEWDGTASFEERTEGTLDSASSRLNLTDGNLVGDGYGGDFYENGVNPDTNHFSCSPLGPGPLIQPGSGAIYYTRFKPFTPGTITFRLIPYETGVQSMLVGMDNNAIIPVFANGTITVLPICGDADRSGAVSISDAVYLINFIFGGGPAPYVLRAGDPNCDGQVSISDVVRLIQYIFAGGAAPCAACP